MPSSSPIITEAMVPESAYRSFMEHMPVATVDIVFVNPERTKVLLGRRASPPYQGDWFAFGGRLFKHEEILDAAARQAMREAGIAVTVDNVILAGVYNEVSTDSKYSGISYHAVVLVCWCVISETTPTLDEQHTEAAWIEIDDPSLNEQTRDRINMVRRSMHHTTL